MAIAHASRRAVWLLVVSAFGLAASLAYYLAPEDGIDGSLGAALVIGTTALMLMACAAIVLGFARGAIKGVLAALILLDIIGTGFAAYMLEANGLIACMALALISWIYAVFAGDRRRPFTDARAAS
jgi:hypothetical protein